MAAVLVTAIVSGCGSAAPATDGPLVMGGGSGELCLPRHPGQTAITYGFEALRNTGPVPAQLTGAELVGPHGTRLRAAYIVPIRNDTLIGAWSSWPPPKDATSGPRSGWDVRTAVDQTRIEKSANVDFNLVLDVALVPANPSDPPGFTAVRVYYDVDGHRYAAEGTTKLVVRHRCS